MITQIMNKTGFILITTLLLSFSSFSSAEEKKSPITQYWMNVSTQNMSIPGMSSEDMSGLEGMMMGRMSGMGPMRSLMLQLNSPRTVPVDPKATHDIPPGQKMGSTLPLLIPERSRPVKDEDGGEVNYEKPKMRMLMYWGCSETVRPGQPKVLDTEKMSMIDFGKAMAGRSGSSQHAPSPRLGWAYAEWPNRENRREVPRGSSLIGDHSVHGNYSPDIKFFVDEKHDFMAPVEFSSVKGGLGDSIRFQWKKIPTALGYFATAMAQNEKTGEMVIWSSSEPQDPGYGLMNYLSPADVSRFIKEKVIMEPEVTSCSIPQGIFKEAKGAAVQFIGYGDELNIAYPPKPKDPKIPHEYIWTMKLRNKSTGMLPLGHEDGQKERRSRGRQTDQEERPAETEKSREGAEKNPDTLNKIRGIFGF
jgi:hypothetical protein